MSMTNEQHYRITGLIGKLAEQLEAARGVAIALQAELRAADASGIANAMNRTIKYPIDKILDPMEVEFGTMQHLCNYLSGFVCVNCDVVMTSNANESGLCSRCLGNDTGRWLEANVPSDVLLMMENRLAAEGR